MSSQTPHTTTFDATPLELLDSYLAACDEALAAGVDPETLLVGETPPELRQQVEQRAGFLRKLQKLRPTRPEAPRDPAAPPWQWLGRFQLHRELGRGGFGIVYLASDSVLDRLVALKVPRMEVAESSVLRERFEREARAVAGLEHPGIVPVYEAGQVGPVSFLVSAYCPGPTLSAWLREQKEPVPFDQAAKLVLQLAEAVQHAHSRGVLHRDLKPGNVLVGYRQPALGDRPEGALPAAGSREPIAVRITDFGLARLVETADAEPLTHTGTVMGTAEYMAPEQAAGKRRLVGPAADIYSLGVILYELLTGRPPFRGETHLDTLMLVQNEEPLPPSRLRPRAPRDLETICLKCLQKEPRQRYASAGDLAADLQSYLDGKPILARPVNVLERAWRWCKRRPAVAALLAALAVIVPLSLTGLTWLWLRAAANAQRANSEWRRAENNLDEARRAVRKHFLELSLVKLGDPSDPREFRKKQLEAALGYFRDFLEQRRDDPAMQLEVAEALHRVAEITAEIGSRAEAQRLRLENHQILEVLSAAHPEVVEYRVYLAGTYIALAVIAKDAGDRPTARQLHEQAHQLLDAVLADHPEDLYVQNEWAINGNNWGGLLWAMDDPAGARRAFEEVRSKCQGLLERHPDALRLQVELANAFHNLGFLDRSAGQSTAAKERLEEARRLRESLLQRYPSYSDLEAALASTCLQLALVHEQERDAATALQLLDEARQILTRLTRTHRAVAAYQHDLALIYANLGRHCRLQNDTTGAIEAFEQARELLQKVAHADPGVLQHQAELATILDHLGMAQRRAGNLAASFRSHERARDILRPVLSKDPRPQTRSDFGGVLNNLGMSLLELQRTAEALATFEEAAQHQRAALEQKPRMRQFQNYLRNHYYNQAKALWLLGRSAEAGLVIERWLDLCPQAPDPMFQWGCEMAGDFAGVEKSHTPLTAAEKTVQAFYAATALAALRRAIANGFKDLEKLDKEPALAPLRHREDFKRLRAEAAASQPPDGP